MNILGLNKLRQKFKIKTNGVLIGITSTRRLVFCQSFTYGALFYQFHGPVSQRLFALSALLIFYKMLY
jgi:hypothetical protein